MNELIIYGDIGENYWSGESLTGATIKDKLDAMPPGDVTVRINSPGGDVFDGFAIYNLIAQREGKTTVLIDGMAASAASVIAMAGDEILMADNALMMIHDPWTLAAGNAEEIGRTVELLNKVKDSIVTTYQKRSNLDAEKIGEMMAAETWLSADDAISQGFATGTVEERAAISNSATNRPWLRNCPKVEAVEEKVTEEPVIEQEEITTNRLAYNKRRLLLETLG